MITSTPMRGGIIGSFQGVRVCGSAWDCGCNLSVKYNLSFVVTGMVRLFSLQPLPSLRFLS